MSFVPRTLIDNRYTLVGPLGSGGMAEVYLAHDEVLDRAVALKILRGQYANNEEFVRLFRREARSAAALNHPNVVAVYYWGRAEDGTYYMSMEHVPGGNLKDRVRAGGPLGAEAAVGMALQVVDASGGPPDRRRLRGDAGDIRGEPRRVRARAALHRRDPRQHDQDARRDLPCPSRGIPG